MKTQKYRYYSSSLSRHTLRSLEKHLTKIGTPVEVSAECRGDRRTGWYCLVVTGTAGQLFLRGCSWGYGGEGPHATRDALLKLGVPKAEADRLAFCTKGDDVGNGATKGKVYFTRSLDGSALLRQAANRRAEREFSLGPRTEVAK